MTAAFVEISVVGGMAIGVGCLAFFACARAFRRVARRRGRGDADADADADAVTKTAAEKDEEEATTTTTVVEIATATPPRKKCKIVPCDAC